MSIAGYARHLERKAAGQVTASWPPAVWYHIAADSFWWIVSICVIALIAEARLGGYPVAAWLDIMLVISALLSICARFAPTRTSLIGIRLTSSAIMIVSTATGVQL